MITADLWELIVLIEIDEDLGMGLIPLGDLSSTNKRRLAVVQIFSPECPFEDSLYLVELWLKNGSGFLGIDDVDADDNKIRKPSRTFHFSLPKLQDFIERRLPCLRDEILEGVWS